jgi:hypothetical protein
MLETFLEEAGYSDDDVLAVNDDTRTILMKNGGLYRISQTGKILHLKGPSPDPTERL